MTRHLLAIDQGTTGSTVLVLDTEARILGRATREFPQHFPTPGEVEHDAEEIWASVEHAIEGAYREAGVDPKQCAGIGITNQRETTMLWDRKTGAHVHRAIVWQDRRTAARCRGLEAEGLLSLYRKKTGLVLDPYFSGTKLEWLLDNVDDVRKRAEDGELAFGTVDSFLVWRLSGGTAHVTDVTNASRTLLFDIHRLAWDDELCRHLHVPRAVLPAVKSSSEVYARTKGLRVLPDGIPIAGIAGDQQAALFGQTCFEIGDAKCTYGTGAFLLVNTGERAPESQNGLVTTVAWKLGDQVRYALEGSAFVAGAAVQWLRDQLGIIKSSSDIEGLAAKVQTSGGVVFVPALSGLGAPHWDPEARGTLFGLTRGSSAAHIARATLEGIAFQVAELGRAMEADMGRRIARLRVDGGASQNELLMQFQADVLDVAIERPANTETTALGAAYLAGLAVGVFPDLQAIERAHRTARRIEPGMREGERREHLARWNDGVRRARGKLV
ncbi:glycerol kinase GlpK [Sandaracinus amylolyticus]|uniref:glycerol kinase GlpK n=1 Tax=Sandaracinus amylolyticus TaxID=927083 RepID=UPI001F013260|nr:glycerol kinase GlpK [Sandaracinus amylolyticus]UJR81966.1 Glycerol kinase GlpK [Sandaracinus amylolyticus]